MLPGVGDEIGLFLDSHLLLEPVLEALVVDISDRAIALTGVEKRVLTGGAVVPADLALDVRVLLLIDDAAVYFNCFLLELFSERVQDLIMAQLLVRCFVVLSVAVLDMVLFGVFIGDWIVLLFDAVGCKFSPVVLHIKLYPAEFHDISSVEFVILNYLNTNKTEFHHI